MNPPFKNKKTLIVFCGVMQILFAVFFFGFTLLMFLPLLLKGNLPSDAQIGPKQLLPAVSMYGAGGLIFLILGIGALRLKRWARTLSQIFYGFGLAFGVLMLAQAFLLNFEIFWQTSPNLHELPLEQWSAVLGLLKIVLVVFVVLFFITLPGLLFWAMQNQNVKATFAFYDPKSYWTERRPVPVLALAFLLGNGGLVYLWLLIAKQAPFLWWILTGPSLVIYTLIAASCLGTVSYLVFKQKAHAWKAALIVTLLFKTLFLVSFSLIDITEYYRLVLANTPTHPHISAEMMTEFWHSSHLALMMWLWGAVGLGFILYTRRFFKPEAR